MRSIALSVVSRLWKLIPYVTCGLILLYIGTKLWSLDTFFVDSAALFSSHAFPSRFPQWLFILLFCPLNWFLEAAKWKASLRSMSDLSFWQSFREVLSGQALNLVAPGSVGHYVGRIAHAQQDSLERVGAVFVCQACQMAITFSASLLGFWYWGPAILPFQQQSAPLILLGILAGLVFVLLCASLVRREWIRRVKYGLKKLSLIQFLEIGMLSLVRYLVFTTQFVLMLQIAGADRVWYELALAISLVFMAKSLMPSIHFMSDLGLREFCALLFLPAIGIKDEIVLLASLWIWLINILLPSLVGAFMLLHVKLVRSWQ